MKTLDDLCRAVRIAKRIWKSPERQDKVISALIRQAHREANTRAPAFLPASSSSVRRINQAATSTREVVPRTETDVSTPATATSPVSA